MRIDQVPTPAYVIDEAKLVKNLEILKSVQDQTGCKVLLAQKAFSMYATYPLISQYLTGTTASGLYEAKLGREEFGGEVHVFAPAFKDSDMDELLEISDHIVFNSERQLRKHVDKCRAAGVSVGLRINPECSTQGEHALYDPCATGSRFGVRIDQFSEDLLDLVDGLHFHTLCEQNSDDLKTTLEAVEDKFGPYLHRIKWLNMGGGHHVTREDYDLDLLISSIQHMQEKYGLEVYIEPGEAIALNAGYLVTEVLDIVENGIETLVLDTSATCHMPDVLEMPYCPPLRHGSEAGERAFTYRLSSNTCLTGDIIGDYSFEKPVEIGDKLYFEDMAIYSFVKNNTFNGIGLPVHDAHSFVLEGGAIHSDGEGTILVTESCLLSPGRNSHLTKDQIEQVLLDSLGAEKVLWLPYGIFNDETNEHVDNVAAFVGPAEIVLAWTDDEADPQYTMSKADLDYLEKQVDAKGRKLTVHKLPIPKHPILITEEDLPGYVYEAGEEERIVGERLAASYVNFYVSNDAVLVPQFDDEHDAQALHLLAQLFPTRKVVGIPARDILLGGGNVHCITQQIPLYGAKCP